MKILSNPTKNKLSITYKGVEHTLPAEGYIEITDENAEAVEYWVSQIHRFLLVRNAPIVANLKKKDEDEKKDGEEEKKDGEVEGDNEGEVKPKGAGKNK